MKLLLIFLTFLVIDCSDNVTIDNQETEKKTLEKLAKEIRTMADDSVCSDEYVCYFVGFGSKPCGGNRGYLVYSSSINVNSFLKKVKKYNELENKYNIKYGIISDCMMVMPPTGTACEDGKCKAIYN
ncbi:MAG: hypothetical protein J7K34_10860 [Flavobacteriaceae bacterium]|nr:hypothetical protein [Flavobacteriaceae bacterium]